MPYSSSNMNGVNGFGNKSFLGAPYKAYGDEKDLGIGTSGEDSSESSSSRSQRRQALEDENTQRRYEEGWRKSSYNDLFANTTQSQFQPHPALYNQKVTAHEWRARLDEHQERKLSTQRERFAYDNYGADIQRRQEDFRDEDLEQRITPTSSLDERSRRKFRSSLQHHHNASASGDESSYQQNSGQTLAPTNGNKRYQRRRSSEDSTRYYQQRWPTSNIEERFMRRQSPSRQHNTSSNLHHEDGEYPTSHKYRPQPPRRSSSHHNLCYPAQTQQQKITQKHPPTYQFGGSYYHH